jgi:hypothetical protein
MSNLRSIQDVLSDCIALAEAKKASYKTNVKSADALKDPARGETNELDRSDAVGMDASVKGSDKVVALTTDDTGNPGETGGSMTQGQAAGKDNEGNVLDRSGKSILGMGEDNEQAKHTEALTTQDGDTAKPAKPPEKLAEEMLISIREYQQKLKSAVDKSAENKTAETKTAETKTAETKTAENKTEDKKPGISAEVTTDDKSASGLNMELTTDVLAKIAACILSTKEGEEYTEAVLNKAAGAEAAQEMFDFLRQQSGLADKQAEAAYSQGSADAEALVKQAQAAMAGAPAAMPVDPAAAGAPQGEATEEDIVAALQELVASGQMDEQTAAQIMEQLAGGQQAQQPVDPGVAKVASVCAALVKAGQISEEEALAVMSGEGQEPEALEGVEADGEGVEVDGEGDIDPEAALAEIEALLESGAIDENDIAEAAAFIESAVGEGETSDVEPEPSKEEDLSEDLALAEEVKAAAAKIRAKKASKPETKKISKEAEASLNRLKAAVKKGK